MPERIFLEDHGERYPRGKIANYPLATWKSFFPGFESFTSPVEEVAIEAVEGTAEGAGDAAPSSPPRRRGRPKKEMSNAQH